jgi:hypothetical protein
MIGLVRRFNTKTKPICLEINGKIYIFIFSFIQRVFYSIIFFSIYISKQKRVYKFNEKLNKIETGYPKLKYEGWQPCMAKY